MNISRTWAMPNSNTFSVPPIGEFVRKYLANSKVSIDPFARNKRWATYTNDLNDKTDAEYHLEASDFLEILIEQEVKADLIIFTLHILLDNWLNVMHRLARRQPCKTRKHHRGATGKIKFHN